ncbi:sensor histidine kinase [Wenzhouxiangella sediminis]|uniref:Sensor histidine kinase n=1 Tax=Wenzhouxiangella sediminis TaxID=1792836 RepID=A0A3E1KAD5_9GAMM|nr:histidine kinase [Wenzhouxiangella sediminis]RFF31103.1 sensor histidine kinase [Wenzhouxiangella sediminis]
MPADLPDLCTPSSILLLVLVGTVVALIFALAGTANPESFWLNFGLSMLFVQWVVLVSAALICGFRRFLADRAGRIMGWALFLVIPVVSLLASFIVVNFLPLGDARGGFWFVLRNVLVSLLASMALVRYLVLQQRWKQQVAAEARARLDALQASIRPHFLFNSLNTIASLVHDKPDEAEQATLDLSDLLRTGLRSGATQSLGEELELVRGYLRLEALRLGERLQVDWRLSDDLPLSQELPALLIQPLVENAVVHGIARLPEGGRLSIRGERASRNRLRFEVVNPLPADSARPAESNRMALDNIRQRLALAYEEGARLKTRREAGCFRVELTVPA